MPKAILVVQTNPTTPELDEQFNAWYTDQHLRDVVAVPGFRSATRYVLSDQVVRDDVAPPAQRYLAIYEVDVDDLGDAAAALMAGVEDGSIPLDESLDMTNLGVSFYLPIDGAAARAGD